MALNANALVTVADVLAYLKDSTTQSGDPNYVLIESLINSASDYCERYIRSPIVNKSLTESYSGEGTTDLYLDYAPIVSLTSFTMDSMVYNISNLDFEDYGLVFFKDGSTFTKGRKNIQITYVAGLGANMNTIPHDVRQACILLVQFWYKRDSQDYSTTFGESEVITGRWRFPQEVNNILDHYRNLRFGFVGTDG